MRVHTNRRLHTIIIIIIIAAKYKIHLSVVVDFTHSCIRRNRGVALEAIAAASDVISARLRGAAHHMFRFVYDAAARCCVRKRHRSETYGRSMNVHHLSSRHRLVRNRRGPLYRRVLTAEFRAHNTIASVEKTSCVWWTNFQENKKISLRFN